MLIQISCQRYIYIQAAGCPRLPLARGKPLQVVPSVPEQPWTSQVVHGMMCMGEHHQSQVQVVSSVPEGKDNVFDSLAWTEEISQARKQRRCCKCILKDWVAPWKLAGAMEHQWYA